MLGSLFLLLSILAMSSIMSTTDFDTLFKGNFMYLTQLFLFYGIFIAFAVKTPTIFLNTWLLKAHVESPLGGSIILAAIVLKLSLYGILRLILPVLPKAYMEYTYIIFLIGVITIVYASLSTLRTIDIKELIAYSSVSHAAVYLLGVFSNSIQGIEGAINLGLAHGLVSPGLFICAGGVLYDRSSTRVISFYRGVTQVMPLFAILFFILCLANCGAPLSLNFIGEFLSLYGVFERSSLFGVFASSSIIFSAAYTIYMYQRIAFGGAYSKMFTFSIPDLTKREFTIKGAGGTGKTFLIQELFKRKKQNKDEWFVPNTVIGVCVTHMARLNLMKSIPNTTTYASAANLTMMYDPMGNMYFVEKYNNYDFSELKSYKYVVVDECSMFDKSMKNNLINCCDTNAKIIWMGKLLLM